MDKVRRTVTSFGSNLFLCNLHVVHLDCDTARLNHLYVHCDLIVAVVAKGIEGGGMLYTNVSRVICDSYVVF